MEYYMQCYCQEFEIGGIYTNVWRVHTCEKRKFTLKNRKNTPSWGGGVFSPLGVFTPPRGSVKYHWLYGCKTGDPGVKQIRQNLLQGTQIEELEKNTFRNNRMQAFDCQRYV